MPCQRAQFYDFGELSYDILSRFLTDLRSSLRHNLADFLNTGNPDFLVEKRPKNSDNSAGNRLKTQNESFLSSSNRVLQRGRTNLVRFSVIL